MEHIIKPIAYIKTDFKEKFGIPRQSCRCMNITGKIEFEPQYRNPDVIRGLEGYSHLWLIFGFNKASTDNVHATVRPPRLGGNTRVGVFATRSPYRPNGLGLSSVEIEKIEDNAIYVRGVDLLDKTPIYDIKPYLVGCDCHPNAKCAFSDENWDYRLDVIIPDELKKTIPENTLKAIEECLGDDPRPAYQEDSSRIYSMKFGEFDIHFKIKDNTVYVTGIDNP